MCDCYSHKCLLCDNHIEMHLGDFATERDEIIVLCPDHYHRAKSKGQNRHFSIFQTPEGKVAVIYKTKNAVIRRHDNEPNFAETELLEEF